MTKVSKCCDSDYRFNGDDIIYEVCNKCNNPCDLIDQPETKEQKDAREWYPMQEIKKSEGQSNLVTNCLLCGISLPNPPTMNVCIKCSEGLLGSSGSLLASKKNEGLTLSEIAKDDDILEFRRKDHEEESYYTRAWLGTSKWGLEYLAATDWKVTKRKSDERKVLFNQTNVNLIMNWEQQLAQLKKENEKHLEMVQLLQQERDELRGKLENNQLIEKVAEAQKTFLDAFCKERSAWKNWPEEKPSEDFCICVIRKGPFKDGKLSFSASGGYIYNTATFRDGGFYSRQIKLSDSEKFQFLVLPE